MSKVEITQTTIPSKATNYFHSDNFLKGYIGKDLVKSLLINIRLYSLPLWL